MHFWLTSAPADFESDQSIYNTQISHASLSFSLPRAPRSSHFPHYRRTSPALASKCRRVSADVKLTHPSEVKLTHL
ncbi:hypothetical protein, partial [Azotobacter vinelandii]